MLITQLPDKGLKNSSDRARMAAHEGIRFDHNGGKHAKEIYPDRVW